MEVTGALFGRMNQEAPGASSVCTRSAGPLETGPLTNRVFLCDLDFGVREPGPYMLRVAVVDRASGKIGSAYAFAPVHDFNTGHLELSSLVLNAASPIPSIRTGFGAAAIPPSHPGAAPGTSRANGVDRKFSPGDTITLYFEVYGAKLDHRTGQPKLHMYIKAGGGQYIPTQGADLRIGIDSSRLELSPGPPVRARGELTIPADAQPGWYDIVVEVTDGLAERSKGDSWGDFTIASRSAQTAAR